MDEKKKRTAKMDHLPRTEAAVQAYAETGDRTDPLGMWTGRPRLEQDQKQKEKPVQDADDL